MRADEGRHTMEAYLNHSSMKRMVTVPLQRNGIFAYIYLAGYTCCAISALSIIHRLPHSTSQTSSGAPGLTNIPETIRWLVSRQVGYKEEEEEDANEPKTSAHPVLQGVYENEPLVPGLSLEDVDFAGFNGRCNKKVDTCYAYWVTASLDVSALPRRSYHIILITL
jgi:prenyltransferase beta subunit